MDNKTNDGIQDYYDRKAAANNAEHWREVAERYRRALEEIAEYRYPDPDDDFIGNHDIVMARIASQALGKLHK